MSEVLTIQTILKVSPNLLILATAGAAHFGMTLEEAMHYPFVNRTFTPTPGMANEHTAEKEAAAAERKAAELAERSAAAKAAAFACAARFSGKSSPQS